MCRKPVLEAILYCVTAVSTVAGDRSFTYPTYFSLRYVNAFFLLVIILQCDSSGVEARSYKQLAYAV